LREEASDYGLEGELTVEDAREIFASLQEEFVDELESGETGGDNVLGSFVHHLDVPEKPNLSTEINDSPCRPTEGEDLTATDFSANRSEDEAQIALFDDESPIEVTDSVEEEYQTTKPVSSEEMARNSPKLDALDGLDENQLFRIRHLQAALPGLPISRIKKVANAFEDTLGYPSLLSLVPLLRETLPDHISLGWLRRMNTRNADFVMQKAEEENIVNLPLLNSMLQTKANSSSLAEAQNFHRDEFRRHNVVSARIVPARQYNEVASVLIAFFRTFILLEETNHLQ
jgi:hypothetical protein